MIGGVGGTMGWRRLACVLASALTIACTPEESGPFCPPADDAIERRIESSAVRDVGGRSVVFTRGGALLTLDDSLATTQVGLLPQHAITSAILDGEIFVVEGRTLSASSDLGRTWSERVYAGTPVGGGDRLYAREDGVVRVSRDGGRSWSDRGSVSAGGYQMTAIGERVWISRADGAIESRDEGATFSRLASGALRVDQPAPGWLVAWESSRPSLHSDDAGETWLPYDGPTVWLTGSLDALYGMRDRQLFTSVDHGRTWQRLGEDTRVGAITASADTVVYAAEGDLFVRRGELARPLRMRREREGGMGGPMLGGDGAIYTFARREPLDPDARPFESEIARSVDGVEWTHHGTTRDEITVMIDAQTFYALRGHEHVFSDDGGASVRTLPLPELEDVESVLVFAAVGRTAYGIAIVTDGGGRWLVASTEGSDWESLGPTPGSTFGRGRDRSGRLYAVSFERGPVAAHRWTPETGWSTWPLTSGCDVRVIDDEGMIVCEIEAETQSGTHLQTHCVTPLEGGDRVCVTHAPFGTTWGRLAGEIVGVDAQSADGPIPVWGADGARRAEVPVDYVRDVLTAGDGLLYAGSARRCDGTHEARVGRIE